MNQLEQKAWEEIVEKLTIHTSNTILRYRLGRKEPQDVERDAKLAKEIALDALEQVLDSESHWDQDPDDSLLSVLKRTVDREIERRLGLEKSSADELLSSIRDRLSGEEVLAFVFSELTAGTKPDEIAEKLNLSRENVLARIRKLKRRVENV